MRESSVPPSITPAISLDNQWLSAAGVKFYSNNFAAPVRISQNCGPCSTTSPLNFIATKPDFSGVLNVEFTIPVSNLNFYMIGVDAFFNNPFAVLDVYRGGSYYTSYVMRGNSTYTVWVNLVGLDNISKIVVRDINDPNGIGFDDFSFNVPADVKITSGRVNGYLNGTTQTALLGADVALNASPLPGAFAGGAYTWSVSGPATIITDTHSSSVTLRSTGVSNETGQGPITVNVSYSRNGIAAAGSLTVNSILPTVINFSGQQTSDTIVAPGGCGDVIGWWWYRLGCSPQQADGIQFSANVHVPTVISVPSQSGMKFVQAVSTYRKKLTRGIRCLTKRSTESDIDSGWQLDFADPYDPPHFFSDGNDLTLSAVDSPGANLTKILTYDFVDALYLDDRFNMYLVYFTTNTPPITRPLRVVPWNWNGQVVFEWDWNIGQNGDGTHKIRSTNAIPTIRPSEAATSIVDINQLVQGNQEVQCPGGPGITNNRIDSSRYFVRQHYFDFLGRDPSAPDAQHLDDPRGWNFWTTNISQCVFDLSCNHWMRIQTGLAFFYSSDFIQMDPIMANGPGTPGFDPNVYNRRFVYWCYKKYLLRDPGSNQVDQSGWDFWTNDLNTKVKTYADIIDAFQVCSDYRNRFAL